LATAGTDTTATATAITAAEIVARLVEGGGRRTASRQAIAEVIAEAGSHFTAEEMARRVQHRFPSVNISTVYRTLDALADLGVVDHVHFGHGRAVYHLRDEAHHHLYCERCERVEELPADKLGSFVKLLEGEYGFELDRRHFAIVGTCRACRALGS
jgi:Fe2+ or Zn2+ uptake regulation protein